MSFRSARLRKEREASSEREAALLNSQIANLRRTLLCLDAGAPRMTVHLYLHVRERMLAEPAEQQITAERVAS